MNTLTLPANCDRAAAKVTFTDICEALGPSALTIDASGVEKIGQTMLQVLIAAGKCDGGIAITDPSPAFRETITLAGLETLLSEEPA
ncbi:MAG: STAS domain-containing protein [Pseudomonadota bacterium]